MRPPTNPTHSAWARVRLTRGRSTGEVWEIDGRYPEARLSLGADPSAGWPIAGAGIHPVHCELFWDGQALWVADSLGVGGVFLDGQRVTEWVQIHGPAEVRFGQAALDVETSAPLRPQMASSPAHARPVTRTDMVLPPERPSQAIFGGAAGDERLPELDGGATRVVAAPPAFAGRPSRPPSAPEAPSLDLRPRLGGAGAGPVAGEATRMVALPAAPPAAPPSAVRASAVRAPAPPPPAAPAFAAPFVPSAPPPPPSEPRPPEPPAPTWSDPGASFAAPPTDAGAKKGGGLAGMLGKLKPQSSAEVVAAQGGKKGQALPTRTWLMLVVTLAAAVGLLLWEEESVEALPVAPPVAPVARVAAPPDSPPVPAAPVVPASPVEPGGELEAARAEPVAVAGAEPSLPPPSVSQPSAGSPETPPATGPSLARQAIDHYVNGRFAEALASYRALAEESPRDLSYATMVRILERRVRCGPGGTACP